MVTHVRQKEAGCVGNSVGRCFGEELDLSKEEEKVKFWWWRTSLSEGSRMRWKLSWEMFELQGLLRFPAAAASGDRNRLTRNHISQWDHLAHSLHYRPVIKYICDPKLRLCSSRVCLRSISSFSFLMCCHICCIREPARDCLVWSCSLSWNPNLTTCN